MEGVREAHDGPEAVARIARDLVRTSLLRGDDSAALAGAQLLLQTSCTLAELYSEILQPVLDEVGERWACGELSVAGEHAVSAAVRGLISRLKAARPALTPSGLHVLLLPLPGEAHTIGLTMMEHGLLDAGWVVTVLDALPVEQIVGYARDIAEVALIGLTLHDPARHPAAAAIVRRIRSDLPAVPVVVGGLAVRRHPELPERLGASGGARSVLEGVRLAADLTNPLSPREFEVLELVSQGLSNPEIAQRTGVRTSTIKTHLERVYVKTATSDRAAAVAVALRRRWLR